MNGPAVYEDEDENEDDVIVTIELSHCGSCDWRRWGPRSLLTCGESRSPRFADTIDADDAGYEFI